MSAPIPDNNTEPGYCSANAIPLTNNQINRILQCSKTGSAPGITIFTEKDLVRKGNRKLFLVDNDVALVEYAGVRKAKFVSKDAERFEAMTEKALEKLEGAEENIKKVVLLAVDGTMCRRNTLPRLHRNSIVVMRCPVSEEEVDTSDDE